MHAPLPNPKPFRPGDTLRILRTIESFQPNKMEPAQQAWQISHRLEQKGIRSPLLTTVASAEDRSTQKETLGLVKITRVPVQCAVGPYKISLGMLPYLRHYHILHSHLYRSFQTDAAFFLRSFGKNRLS